MAFPQVSWATEPGSCSVPNEDFVLTVPGIVIVLDGVTRPPGAPTGCVHGTPWYVRHLGTDMLRRLLDDPVLSLTSAVESAIDAVAARHGDTCDLAHPATPAATLAILRTRYDVVDYLVMGDSVVVTREAERVRVFTDPENLAVAAADPKTGFDAVVGAVPLIRLQRAAVLTDGASRLVDEFGLTDWPGLLDICEEEGPGGLIGRVRDAEARDSDAAWWPRAKIHDDATAVFWRCALTDSGTAE